MEWESEIKIIPLTANKEGQETPALLGPYFFKSIAYKLRVFSLITAR
jgi:hypothetical protein